MSLTDYDQEFDRRLADLLEASPKDNALIRARSLFIASAAIVAAVKGERLLLTELAEVLSQWGGELVAADLVVDDRSLPIRPEDLPS
jgi:hypothetical protein